MDSTNNRVGIGTASPSVTLDISGAASISGNLTVDTTTFRVDAINDRVGIGTVSPSTALQVVGTVTATTFSGSGASLTALPAANLSGTTLASGVTASSLTSVGTLTGLTLDGPSSPSMFFGDWNQNNEWSGIRGTHGYLLTGNSAGATGVFLRSESATHPVYIGSNNTNTLVVTNNSATVTGTITASSNIGWSASTYLTPVTGVATNFGSVKVTGTPTSSGWAGYSINGDAVFMSQSSYFGLYDNTNLEWGILCTRNGTTELFHNGSSKIQTTSTGATTTGTHTATTFIGALSGNATSATSATSATTAGSATTATTAGSPSGSYFIGTYLRGIGAGDADDHSVQGIQSGNGGDGAAVAMWASGVAPQFRVGASNNTVYLQNANDTVALSLHAYIITPSSVHVKQDIVSFPSMLRSAGAAVNEDEILTGLNIVRQLRPVTYRWKEKEHFSQLPENPRRALALSRLNTIRKSKGLKPYDSDELHHDCSRNSCSGTAESPCQWTKNWEIGNIGFISQEVGAVIPQATFVDKDGDFAALDSLALTAIAVSAIKEMDATITLLKQRIETLENK